MHTLLFNGTLANFSTYGLMYLLMRDKGIESLTYFRFCSMSKAKDGRHGNREALQKHMRTWMGGESFERLRNELLAEGFSDFVGEPDLFCWNPGNRAWFFAETKWKDKLTETQPHWFRVCRRTLSDVTIKVYRLRPLPAGQILAAQR